MNKISSRILRSEMPGLWATEIRGASWSGEGHRYLCRAISERSAAAQAGRIMGATHGATGFDIYWIEPRQLAQETFELPEIDAHCAVWDTDEWSRLIAAHHASEQAAPDRHSIDP
jgi:hypothetical protein